MVFTIYQKVARARLDSRTRLSIDPVLRIDSTIWLILRDEEGMGFAWKYVSISCAFSTVLNRATQLMIRASINDGLAFANFDFKNATF